MYGWTLSNATSTTGESDPMGNARGVILAGAATSGVNHSVYSNNTISSTSGATYCCSVFAKPSQTNYLQMYLGTGSSRFDINSWANFNLSTGAMGSVGSSVINSGIEEYPNGWYRCWFTCLSTGTGSGSNVWFVPAPSTTHGRGYSFDGTNHSIAVWGAQLEKDATSPTSFILTKKDTATRTAESVTAPLVAANAYTLYVEGRIVENDAYRIPASLSDGSSSDQIRIDHTGETLRGVVVDGTTQAVISNSNTTYPKDFKAAIAMALNDVAFSALGETQQFDAAATVPTIDELELGDGPGLTGYSPCFIKKVKVWRKRISNSELEREVGN